MAREIMTARQAAEYLQIGIVTLYTLAKAHKIPTTKIGRQWRFKKSDIDHWISDTKFKKQRGA